MGLLGLLFHILTLRVMPAAAKEGSSWYRALLSISIRLGCVADEPWVRMSHHFSAASKRLGLPRVGVGRVLLYRVYSHCKYCVCFSCVLCSLLSHQFINFCMIFALSPATSRFIPSLLIYFLATVTLNSVFEVCTLSSMGIFSYRSLYLVF